MFSEVSDSTLLLSPSGNFWDTLDRCAPVVPDFCARQVNHLQAFGFHSPAQVQLLKEQKEALVHATDLLKGCFGLWRVQHLKLRQPLAPS